MTSHKESMMVLETERLVLREMTEDDFDALYAIFSDEETMKYYPYPFSPSKVHDWIAWNQENYKVFGFGLFAVVLKENGLVIGDTGITMQVIHGKIKPEIGYHIQRTYQNKGYASESARKCRDFIFEKTPCGVIYSYMGKANIASARVAQNVGMRLVDAYGDSANTPTSVYAISREEWCLSQVAQEQHREV
jgi:RimJ/RimL family protein N-acetyltransferase